MILVWTPDRSFPQVLNSQLLEWRDGIGRSAGLIWIEPRPPYCDRGRWKANTSFPLDGQEGWPRYYFSLEVAKAEVQAWADARAELREPAEGST